MIPHNPEEYLTQLYGDWKMPPKDKVVHPMELLFKE
jgi:hypothetical protein